MNSMRAIFDNITAIIVSSYFHEATAFLITQMHIHDKKHEIQKNYYLVKHFK